MTQGGRPQLKTGPHRPLPSRTGRRSQPGVGIAKATGCVMKPGNYAATCRSALAWCARSPRVRRTRTRWIRHATRITATPSEGGLAGGRSCCRNACGPWRWRSSPASARPGCAKPLRRSAQPRTPIAPGRPRRSAPVGRRDSKCFRRPGGTD